MKLVKIQTIGSVMLIRAILFIVWVMVRKANAFTSPYLLRVTSCVQSTSTTTIWNGEKNTADSIQGEVSRRDLIASLGFSAAFLSQARVVSADSALDTAESQSGAPREQKILVLGGTGFVGSQVVQTLKDMGIPVVATSRNGRDGTVALDVTKDGFDKTIKRLVIDVTAVISCIGAIGTEKDQVINSATAVASQLAKEAGVDRFVYITVAPEVQEIIKDIDFLKGYAAGKEYSRSTVLSNFGKDNAILIEPTFVYGGGSFELNPPRVASFYGRFIEEFLSSNPIRSVDKILPPGIVKIALEPPVPVEAIASAAVAGALVKTDAVLDTYDKIKRASQLL